MYIGNIAYTGDLEGRKWAWSAQDNMGSLGFSSSVSYAIALLGLLLNAVAFCNGGTTSAFVRKVEKTVDMPLDSDVFRAPPGYNAPQQVLVLSLLHPFFSIYLYSLL